MNGVVTIKVWKRPDMLDVTLDSIIKVPEHTNYKYIISVDNHPTTKEAAITAVRKFKNNTKADVQLYYQKTNLGCAGNMKFCFENKTWCIEQYE